MALLTIREAAETTGHSTHKIRRLIKAAGNDTLDAAGLATIPATLDGGAGNNTLYGGQAGDILIGGSNGGEGKQGSNTIIAGNGNNTIYGNAEHGYTNSTGGNHLIIGGNGHDTIYGSYKTVTKLNGQPSNGAEGGQNLIIGGGGDDTIFASQTQDGAEGGKGSILVAGTTTLDQSGLVAILSEWTSTRDAATRLANIRGYGDGPRNNGNYYLQPGVTVANDNAVDALFGDSQGGVNWFLLHPNQDASTRSKNGDLFTDTL